MVESFAPETPAQADDTTRPEVELDELPLFQRLLEQSIQEVSTPHDRALLGDFARHVAGPLSDHLAGVTAKGGNFFRARDAEGRKDTARYRLDQSLRAHLVNGLLPVLRIARHLADWQAARLRYWDELAARLFVAGFVLHDYTKLPQTRQTLLDRGFREYEPPSPDLMPVLADLFRTWCARLSLDAFLEPVGGGEHYLYDLIYIASNTQRLKDTARNLSLFPRLNAPAPVRQLATDLSTLADLLAYVAPNPRDLVRHRTINNLMRGLAANRDSSGVVARLTYHHVAENRGLLLNFIHDAALSELQVPGQREPLLYAPSGVVYLERHDAPPVPDKSAFVQEVVATIRSKAGRRIRRDFKGAKRGNVGLLIDDTLYSDFFDLREFIRLTPDMTTRLIRSNKSQDRLDKLIQKDLPGNDHLPPAPADPADWRLDWLAEWAARVERVLRDRLDPETADRFARWLVERLEMGDLYETFEALREAPDVSRKMGGVFVWWFWLGGHWLARNNTLEPEQLADLLTRLAAEVADNLLDPLPDKAQANREIWDDLADYVTRVLTLGDGTLPPKPADELAHYTATKARRGAASCALCGSTYSTREQMETSVAFQPGVYTSRVPIGQSSNKRQICSICALEQLLRQLYLSNLDTGSSVESQRVRYLTLYPTYFFTPETLNMAQRVYHQLKQVSFRFDLKRPIERQADLRDPAFWQRLGPFLLDESADQDGDNRRVLRFDRNIPASFFLFGLRNFSDPTDSESWVLPALLALILPLCLDVKVVASESGVPLMLEADELPEMVWLDGAHPAIRAVLDGARYKVARMSEEQYQPGSSSGPLNLDELPEGLAWLAAAYVIHVDTEGDRRSDNWGRLPAIAHALAESPLYAFHFLKHQERNSDHSAGRDKVRRYVHYAHLFSYHEENGPMSHASTLVDLYRGFYRAKNIKNSNSILRPLSVVADALLNADPRLFPDAEALTELAYGELHRFMDRVGSGAADGRFPKGITAPERQEKMRAFCAYFVTEIFVGIFNRDVAALRGRQLNLLRSACEVIYRDRQSEEWAARPESDEAEAEAES